MFKVKNINAPVHLYFITKHPFPEGISSAWAELEHHIPERSGLKFYGVFDGQQYFAGCDDPGSISISRESLLEYVITAGTYLTHTIHNWQDKKEQIALTFQQMEEDPRSLNTGPDIEFYKSYETIVCLKKIKPTD